MDLRHAVAALHHWRWVLAVLLFSCVGLAGAYAAVAPREYESSTTVFFSLNRSTSVSDLAQGSTYTQEVVKSYSEVVTLPLVLDPVIERLRLEETPRELARRIRVDAQPDTVLADITVTDGSPERAALIADAVSFQLAKAVLSLSPGGASSPAAIRVITIARAEVPTLPSSPNVPLLLGLGLVAGLVLGVGTAIVLELVRSPLVTAPVAEQVAPVVGKITHDPKARSRPLPVSTHPQLRRAESFRALRTNLSRLSGPESSQCLVVTSAVPREGRTSVAVNLAIAVSHSFRSVLLIDADLRRPAVASSLGLDGTVGLVDVLMGEANLDDVTQMWQTQTWRDSTLHVLPAGRRTTDSSGVLARATMTQLIEVTKNKYDLVILDTPPLLPVTDAALLAPQTDGALLVTNARSTREREFTEAVNALQLAGASVQGVIFNFVGVPRSNRYGPQLYGPRRHIWKR